MARLFLVFGRLLFSISLPVLTGEAQAQEASHKPIQLPPVIVVTPPTKSAKPNGPTKPKKPPAVSANGLPNRSADAGNAETMVSSPTRLPTPVSHIGSSVTVITGQDLERQQQRTVPDALRDVPGLNIV